MSFLYRWPMSLPLAAAVCSVAMAQSPSAPDLEAEKVAITKLRRASNEAIATRDLEGTMRMFAEDYVAVSGNDGITRSKSESREHWAKDFALLQPLNQCVRRPTTIAVGQSGGILRAAESGSWQCPRETSSGAATPYGSYFAHWSKRSKEWRLVGDNYVTLGCRGAGC
jgi:ketosteroid isomerase-like protein